MLGIKSMIKLHFWLVIWNAYYGLWYIFFDEYMAPGKGEKDVLVIKCYELDKSQR